MGRSGEGTKFTIDRKIFSSDIWFDSPWKLKIWIYLIGNANHKDGVYEGIKIKRGQLIRSYRTIRKQCGYKVGYRMKYPSLATVKRICEDLTKDARIERRTEHCGTLFTILNYSKLQLTPKYEANDERTTCRTLGEQNNNNINKTNIKTSTADAVLIDKINTISEALYRSKKFPKVHAFKNKMLKDSKNHNALLHALTQVQRLPIKSGAWAYCTKIMQVENGNYNEADYVKNAQKQQRELDEWVNENT
jgi:hypothetical protein